MAQPRRSKPVQGIHGLQDRKLSCPLLISPYVELPTFWLRVACFSPMFWIKNHTFFACYFWGKCSVFSSMFCLETSVFCKSCPLFVLRFARFFKICPFFKIRQFFARFFWKKWAVLRINYTVPVFFLTFCLRVACFLSKKCPLFVYESPAFLSTSRPPFMLRVARFLSTSRPPFC